jgi:hypothetical protein
MGMFSEIATESTIKAVVNEIKKEIEESKDKPDAIAALKKIGRFALNQFEYSTPEWAKEFDILFRE